MKQRPVNLWQRAHRGATSLDGDAFDGWRLSTSYKESSPAEQWSRNVAALVRVNRSLRGERGDRTRVTVPVSVPTTRLFSVRPNFNGKRRWQAASGANATRALAFPATPSILRSSFLGCFVLMRCRWSPEIDTGHRETACRIQRARARVRWNQEWSTWKNRRAWQFRRQFNYRFRVKLIGDLTRAMIIR